MGFINYAAGHRLLFTAGGHPYDRNACAGLFDQLDDFACSLVEQPAALELLGPELRDWCSACVCYDMPGLNFSAPDAPGLVSPDERFKARFLELLDVGMGFVFLHHSIASWPAWPEFANIVGGRFHYRSGCLGGRDWPDSGYRHEVEHRISVMAPHPVTAGLPEQFGMVDELYLCPQLDEDCTPLLRSDYDFTSESFYSSRQAVQGRMYSREGWTHPTGNGVVAWVKHYGNSPIVYLQGGDDARAWENPYFRRLVHNAVRWVASDAAHQWARGFNRTVD